VFCNADFKSDQRITRTAAFVVHNNGIKACSNADYYRISTDRKNISQIKALLLRSFVALRWKKYAVEAVQKTENTSDEKALLGKSPSRQNYLGQKTRHDKAQATKPLCQKLR